MTAGSPGAVVVTGAANGIGQATAALLAGRGWSVVAVDRERQPLEEAMASIGGTPVVGDVRDEEVLFRARRTAEERGGLGAWVNNAGVVRLAPLHLMATETIDELLAIDLRAVVLGTREALRSFLAHGTRGAIVNLSSVHARGSFPGYGAYDAAKGGVEALTRYVCVEYGHLGIRANAVAPGAVRTSIVPLPAPGDPPPASFAAGAPELAPMRRESEPLEIAEAIGFLLENRSLAVNGHVLAVDNGMSSWNSRFPPDPTVAFPTGRRVEGSACSGP